MPYTVVITFQNKTDGNSTIIHDTSTTLEYSKNKLKRELHRWIKILFPDKPFDVDVLLSIRELIDFIYYELKKDNIICGRERFFTAYILDLPFNPSPLMGNIVVP